MARSKVPPAVETPSLEFHRSFPATCEQLYRCFTEAEQLTQWFGPEGVSCPRASVDARPGGRYRIEMANPDGSLAVVVGRFLELDPPRLIRMTWCWETWPDGPTGEESLVTIDLEPQAGGALLTLTHERLARSQVVGVVLALAGAAAITAG